MLRADHELLATIDIPPKGSGDQGILSNAWDACGCVIETPHPQVEPEAEEALLLRPREPAIVVLDIDREIRWLLHLDHEHSSPDGVGDAGWHHIHLSWMHGDPIEGGKLRLRILQLGDPSEFRRGNTVLEAQENIWRFALDLSRADNDPRFGLPEVGMKVLSCEGASRVRLNGQAHGRIQQLAEHAEILAVLRNMGWTQHRLGKGFDQGFQDHDPPVGGHDPAQPLSGRSPRQTRGRRGPYPFFWEMGVFRVTLSLQGLQQCPSRVTSKHAIRREQQWLPGERLQFPWVMNRHADDLFSLPSSRIRLTRPQLA
jgi:hypothetical protein